MKKPYILIPALLALFIGSCYFFILEAADRTNPTPTTKEKKVEGIHEY